MELLSHNSINLLLFLFYSLVSITELFKGDRWNHCCQGELNTKQGDHTERTGIHKLLETKEVRQIFCCCFSIQ